MGDPVTTSLVLTAGSSLAKGAAGAGEARAAKEDAQINSYIGRTRAIQTDTAAREGLQGELANLRAVLAGNGETPSVGSFEVMQELRKIRSRERRVEVSNRMQESYDYARQARNAKAAGKRAVIGGIAGAAPSMYNLYDRLK